MSLTIRSTMNNQAGVQDVNNADKKADNTRSHSKNKKTGYEAYFRCMEIR